MTESIDTRLSYSSATLLKNCSMKYYHHKVAGTEKDPDAEENYDAFNVGKAFHYVLEENGHTERDLIPLLEAACKTFEVEDKQGMIHAMLLRYLQVHQRSELKAIKCELSMSNEIFIGFIDVILKDVDGGWWIADLKTAKFFTDVKKAMLARDPQLNLYAAFADDIAAALNLDPKKFMGCRYRVTTKSDLKRKLDESYGDHVKRTAKNVKSYDVVIPAAALIAKETYAEHKKLHAKSMRLRKGTLKPERNRSHCDAFFKPCEYFSQCYGCSYTEMKDKLLVVGSNNVEGQGK